MEGDTGCSLLDATLVSISLIESMMGFWPRQGNLRLVFRLFSLMRGLPRAMGPLCVCARVCERVCVLGGGSGEGLVGWLFGA